ncbi:MAG: hypothetical protein A2Y40_09345 [Candidatus Margulisbacteria bacterium GWF2_35_9]|nr:MAG: hypothetical protein A2Y40_09345 [Candidatus Margulisbacteria bacterium GWF2_35_9]
MLVGRAYKINDFISAKDIVRNSYSESYNNILSINPFANKIPDFNDKVFSKTILVSGDNFGFASTRELPSLVLKKAGVKAIIAKSFFAGFYKNAFNLGLLCIEANTDYIDDNDELKIDIRQAEFIQNKTKKIGIKMLPVKKYFYKLYINGGLLNKLYKDGVINGQS